MAKDTIEQNVVVYFYYYYFKTNSIEFRGRCYPVCGMMHLKENLLLIRKSSPCGGSGFPFSLDRYHMSDVI